MNRRPIIFIAAGLCVLFLAYGVVHHFHSERTTLAATEVTEVELAVENHLLDEAYLRGIGDSNRSFASYLAAAQQKDQFAQVVATFFGAGDMGPLSIKWIDHRR